MVYPRRGVFLSRECVHHYGNGRGCFSHKREPNRETWLRKIILEVGRPGEIAERFEKNRIAFDVEMDSKGKPNTAEIELYNPDPGLAQRLEEPGAFIRLYAGYGTVSRIFEGQIIIDGAHMRKESVDRILKIEANDGGRKLANAFQNISFATSTTMVTALHPIVTGKQRF